MHTEYVCARINVKTQEFKFVKRDDDSLEESFNFVWHEGFVLRTGALDLWNNGNFDKNKCERLVKQYISDFIEEFEQTFLMSWSNKPISQEISNINDLIDQIKIDLP